MFNEIRNQFTDREFTSTEYITWRKEINHKHAPALTVLRKHNIVTVVREEKFILPQKVQEKIQKEEKNVLMACDISGKPIMGWSEYAVLSIAAKTALAQTNGGKHYRPMVITAPVEAAEGIRYYYKIDYKKLFDYLYDKSLLEAKVAKLICKNDKTNRFIQQYLKAMEHRSNQIITYETRLAEMEKIKIQLQIV